MRFKQRIGKGLLAAAIAAVVTVGGVGAQVQPAAQNAQSTAALTSAMPGSTRPSIQAGLSLNIPRVVKEVPVKPGDSVKKGDVLLAEEDFNEQVRLKLLKH